MVNTFSLLYVCIATHEYSGERDQLKHDLYSILKYSILCKKKIPIPFAAKNKYLKTIKGQ